MNKSCNIDITHVISDQVSGNLTIVKSILHDQSSHVISKLYIVCRIASTCQLSCNVDITPHRINIKPHNFAMFSPATAAAILNRRNQNHGQEPSSSVTSTRRTSPWLQPTASHARGGASSQGLLSGGTTESRRGGGTDTNTAPTPSRRLPFGFGSVDWGETPIGTYSVSSTLTPLTHPDGAPLLLLILLRPQKGQRGRRTLLRGRGVILMTLMMVVINMITRTILSQPPMVTSRLQPKMLRTTCSLLKKQQNSLRSTAKNS